MNSAFQQLSDELKPREQLRDHVKATDMKPEALLAILLKTGTADCHVLETARRLLGKAPVDFPPETAIGALGLYVSNPSVGTFQPMNINFGIIPGLGYKVKGKRNKNAVLSERSLTMIEEIKEEVLAK